MFEICCSMYFSGAHYLKGYGGKCESLHGHNWKVDVVIIGESLNDIGILYDFNDLKKMLKEVLSELDHKNLNELKQFEQVNPSSENIARFIFQQMKKKLKSQKSKLKEVRVWESESSYASYHE